MKVSVLVIGDTHFKISNVPETELFIDQITEIVEDKMPDFVVLLGDILDTFERLHTTPLNKAYEFINNIRKITPTYVLVGNHDYINCAQFLTENHWMNFLKEWDNVTIVDNVVIDKIGGEKFIFVPYVFPGRFIEALNTNPNNWKDASCIFAHQEFHDCKFGTYNSVIGDKWDINYPLVVSGHIHLNQRVQENIYYPGSSLEHGYDSTKNIISYITFENKKFSIYEIPLQLIEKKIYHVSINDIDDFILPDGIHEEDIKLSISGDYNEFKSFKTTKKYKEIIKHGIKIIYKPKKIETKIKNENLLKIFEKNTNDLTNFKKIINDLIENENKDIKEVYELIINNKEINIDEEEKKYNSEEDGISDEDNFSNEIIFED